MVNNRYMAVICPTCNTKQAVDIQQLCMESNDHSVVLSPQSEDVVHSRCVVTCKNKACTKRRFVIEDIDCTGYV